MKSKILAVLLTFVVIFNMFSLWGCEKDREYDEAEVKEAAVELINTSEMLNSVYYGHGIPYVIDGSTAEGYYYEADFLALHKLGFETLSELMIITRDTFSTQIANGLYSAKLTNLYDANGNISVYARYYQKYSALEEGVPECIMVYSKAEPLLKDTVIYDYDSLMVKGSKGQTVYVEIAVTVVNEDGKSQNKKLEIGLIEEAGGWRLSTPTYTSYANLDYYNELQNKK